jgi:hypothetical protein
MQLKKVVYLLALLVLGLALSAQASTIGNGPPNHTGASDLNGALEADNFTLGAGFTGINSITFWAAQGDASDYAGSIYWAFYSDAAGAPGAALASGLATPTGVATGNTDSFGLSEFLYHFNVSVALADNSTYWLVLHNGPAGVDPGTNFYWAWSNDTTGDSQSSFLNPVAWSGNSAELAFQVEAVPEPASLCLMGGGLLAGWFKKRRLQSKN